MGEGTHSMKKNMSVELQLLLTIIGEGALAEKQQSIRSVVSRIDWNIFLLLASEHRVYPRVANVFNQLDCNIPLHVMETLNQKTLRNTLKMLKLTAAMERVCYELSQNHIQVLVLKGPVLAEALYGDFSQRTSKDIDILVSGHHFEKAQQVLLQLGYQPDEEIPILLTSVIRRHHHLGYTHPLTGVQVELHWRMSADVYKEPKFTELWERRRETVKTSIPVYFLGHDDLFVYLISHGARHGWFRLRWLADIERMIQMGLDWENITDKCRQLNKIHILGQTLVLVSELFHVQLSRNIIETTMHKKTRQLAEEAIKIINEYVYILRQNSQFDQKYYFKHYTSLLLTPRQKIKLLLNKLYPHDIDTQMLALPRWLHFMYFPLRPFIWVIRKSRDQLST